MKLIQFREPGPPNVLQCLDVPVPEPKPDEVLIRAHAIGVGMPDVLIRAGTYNFMPPLPATPGRNSRARSRRSVLGSLPDAPASASTPAPANDRIAADTMRNSSLRRQRRPISCPRASISMPRRR